MERCFTLDALRFTETQNSDTFYHKHRTDHAQFGHVMKQK